MKSAAISVVVALSAGVIVLYLFAHGRPENIVLSPYLQLVLSILLGVGSLLLFRRGGGPAAFLLVIGSAGWFVFWSLNAFSEYTFTKEPGPLDGCIYRHWSLCILEHVGVVATLCFPIGFLWLALRASRHT
jgi:hypothetical protein